MTAVRRLPEIGRESLPNGRFLIPRPAGNNTKATNLAELSYDRF
jgi:hypothetical protein